MAETVEFLDTTLRDGNKLPFVVLDRNDRLVIARQLATLGVDIIDAGYPAASAEERDIVGAIAEEVRGPRISALSTHFTRREMHDALVDCVHCCRPPWLPPLGAAGR